MSSLIQGVVSPKWIRSKGVNYKGWWIDQWNGKWWATRAGVHISKVSSYEDLKYIIDNRLGIETLLAR